MRYYQIHRVTIKLKAITSALNKVLDILSIARRMVVLAPTLQVDLGYAMVNLEDILLVFDGYGYDIGFTRGDGPNKDQIAIFLKYIQ